MSRKTFFLLWTLAAVACASSGQSSGESEAEDTAETVQVTVINEYLGTVTAYAVWGQGRVRIGDVGQGRTRMFDTPVRGDRLSIGLQANATPPPGTSSGPNRFGPGGGGDADPSAPYARSESIAVVAGDALEFRLSASGTLTVRRLTPGL